MKPSNGCIDSFYVLNELGPKASVRLLGSRILSFNHYYVLKKNLVEPLHGTNPVRDTMKISPICEKDIGEILISLAGCPVAERRDVLAFLLFFQSGFKNCYVMRRDGKVAYMQTLIFPTENGLIADKYSRKFYPLKDTQVMIENVFTFPPYRGLGCFQSGTRQLLELARCRGYRAALSYVRGDRVASLTELVTMGFKITKMIPEYKLFGAVWRGL